MTESSEESSLPAVSGDVFEQTRGDWSEMHHKLINRLVPPSVIVDSRHEIVHMSESVGRFLQFTRGEPTRNVLRLVHPMLRIELREVLYRAAQTQQEELVNSVLCEIDDDRLRVTIRVIPVEEVINGGWLIVFDSRPANDANRTDSSQSHSEPEPPTRHLEHELERGNFQLRDTVEQCEASTEELQAMNEELRSAIEELETSRQELQSINEELISVKRELKSKVEELGRANDDLHKLMTSNEIGTAFLDRDRKFTRSTSAAIDMSDGKAAEEALRSSEEELRQSNIILDERIKERTRELFDSERLLRVAAQEATHRADQMRDLATQVSEAEQKERRRLACILHDHIQQSLVAARLRAEVLANEAASESTQEHLKVILQSINDTITVARTLAVELVPPLLHEQGLPQALEWLATQFKQQFGLTVDVIAGTKCTPKNENDRDLLFQAVRELLLNIVKHAKVKKAEVRLTCNASEISIEVRDHGTGFNPKLSSGNSFGLFNIRERLQAHGGDLIIESQRGKGTRVGLSLPVSS